jgi:hypothetical protein
MGDPFSVGAPSGSEAAGEALPTKRCPGCEQTKTLDGFFRNRARRDGCSTYCRACRALNVSATETTEALLPTGPLLAALRGATGERGNRGTRSGEAGVHQLAARMQALFGGDYETYRVQVGDILQGSIARIHFTTADRLCMALGRHPAEVWRGRW